MGLVILLPLDGSRYADAASEVALQIAGAHDDARIVALHVVNVRPGSGNILEDLPGHLGFEPAVVAQDLSDARQAAGKALLDDFVKRAAAAQVEVEPVLKVGAVAQTLVEHGNEADLVILGLRGETEERFKGQGGEMIAWLPPRVSVPVLMLPDNVRKLERLAIGYDGSDSAKHALRALRLVADPLEVQVDAIYVSSDGSGGEVLADLDRLLPDAQVTRHVVQGDDVHKALAEQARKLGASALVLGFRGRSKVKDLLFGTATERLEIEGTLGLLVVH